MFGLFLIGKVAQMAQFASIFAYGTLADAVRIKPNPFRNNTCFQVEYPKSTWL